MDDRETTDDWARDALLAAEPRAAARVHEGRRSTRSRWWKVALGVAVGAVSYVVGYSWVDWIDRPSTEDATARLEAHFSAEQPAEFYAADGRFRATFPGPPVSEEHPLDLVPGTPQLTAYWFENEDAAHTVAFFDLPPGSAFDLNGALNGMAVAAGGSVESGTMTEHDGHEAIEGLLEAQGFKMRALVVRVGDRVYEVGVVATGDPEDAFREFVASFEVDTAPSV